MNTGCMIYRKSARATQDQYLVETNHASVESPNPPHTAHVIVVIDRQAHLRCLAGDHEAQAPGHELLLFEVSYEHRWLFGCRSKSGNRVM